MVKLDPSHPLDKLILQRKGHPASKGVIDVDLSAVEEAGLKRKCDECKAALAAPEPVEAPAPKKKASKKKAKKE